MVLATVLILFGVIVALALQAQMLAYSGLKLEKNRLWRTQLRKTAADSAWHALRGLAADANLLIDSTNEAWAAPIRLRLPDNIETEAIVIDENRFVDINMLAAVLPAGLQRPPAEIISDLLAAERRADPELRTRIMQDWLDADQLGQYEGAYYRKLPYPVAVADASSESQEELLWLLEAATNAEARASALTVVPGPTPRVEPVNVNTAGRAALLAVCGQDNQGLVENILRLRDPLPIPGLERLLDAPALQRLAPYLTVHSSVFSIRARASKDALTEEIYCLARRDQSGNVSILRWVER